MGPRWRFGSSPPSGQKTSGPVPEPRDDLIDVGGRKIPRLPSICRSYGASSRFGPTAIKISLLRS